ncbi:MAG: MFS transporter, partial [Pseudomonadota bacterium]
MTPIRRLITAAGLTNLGDGIAVLAWAWAASLLTRDAVWVAMVPVAVRLPSVCGVSGGTVCQRMAATSAKARA